MLGDFYMAPRLVRIQKHKQIRGAVAAIFAIISFPPARVLPGSALAPRQSTPSGSHRNTRRDTADRVLQRIDRAHPPYEQHQAPSTFGMHHISFCQGFNSFSARRRRTVSRDKSARCSRSASPSRPPNKSNVQRARPAGGFERRSPPAAPLPGRSVCALPQDAALPQPVPSSRLPSTKRRLVRYTLEAPTDTLAAIASSTDARIGGQQDLRAPLILREPSACRRSTAR